MMKTLVQCDFDGTITEVDASFLLLDAFAREDWRQFLREYREGKISVGDFNKRAFALVSASKQELLQFITREVKIRPGFHELIAYCRRMGFKFVIVSNGMDFYIKRILQDISVDGIEVFAAQARFHPEGIEAIYIGPDDIELESNFKEAHLRSFLRDGYRIIYVGDGISDISPARLAHHIFARGELLAHCERNGLKYTAFADFNDVIGGLELLQ
jgi:2-hydroxy-3-keto-5-methylthiopentenyl-1-phosphate phosphatase